MNSIDFLQQLIHIPSITDSKDESEPVKYIGKLLKRHGIAYKIIGKGSKQNLVAEIGKGSTCVLLNSHFDVVPASKDVFTPVVKGDKLYGRGAADAKGPLVAMLYAFITLSQQKLQRKVIFCAVSDEENAGEQGTKILAEKRIIADYNIAGEPTNLNIICAEKGFLRLNITILGQELHAAFPDSNHNAIALGARVIQAIEHINFSQNHPLLGKPSISFGLIHGGNKINIGAGKCEIGIDIRYIPRQSEKEIIKQIEQVIKPICKCRINIIGSGVPFETSKKSALVQIAQEVSHGNVQGVNFGTDARFYTPKQAIVFGPGKSEIAHQEKEYIEISQLERAVKLYEEIVRRLLAKKSF